MKERFTTEFQFRSAMLYTADPHLKQLIAEQYRYWRDQQITHYIKKDCFVIECDTHEEDRE